MKLEITPKADTTMKQKVIVRAPVLTRSGYGEHGRFVLRALRRAEDKYDIHVIPVNWGKCGWISGDDEERAWIDELIQKTAIYHQRTGGKPQYDISLQVTIPNEWQPMAPINIGVTAGIETNRVAPVWLEKANFMHKIITVSEHSKQVFLNSSYDGVVKETGEKALLTCLKDVEVVHYPVKKHEEIDLNLDIETDFNFLAVAQWGPRKNLENTVKWFVEEFIDNPDVGLVLKTFSNGNSLLDREDVQTALTNMLDQYENRQCKVYLLHGDMTDQEMDSLYKHPKVNALVTLTHGEGFGLPLFEAAYNGLPVLAPEWSGHVDFLFAPKKDKKSGKEKMKPHFARVEYDLEAIPEHAVWDGVLERGSLWAYPKQGSYKMKLREMYKDYGRFKKHAKELKKWVLENFSEDKQYTAFTDCLSEYTKEPEENVDVQGWLDELNEETYE